MQLCGNGYQMNLLNSMVRIVREKLVINLESNLLKFDARYVTFIGMFALLPYIIKISFDIVNLTIVEDFLQELRSVLLDLMHTAAKC